MHHVLHTAQPHLYSSAGSCIEASPVASMSRPDLEGGVAAPGGLGWPSQGSGHHGSLSQVPGAMHGYWASEAPRAVDQPQCGYRRLQDGCPAGDKVSRAGKDWGAREVSIIKCRPPSVLGMFLCKRIRAGEKVF